MHYHPTFRILSRFARGRAFLALSIAACCMMPATAQNAGRESVPSASSPNASITQPSFQAGLKALNDQLPDMAVNHFKKALEAGKGGNEGWSPDEQVIIRELLAESYARAGKANEALDLYSSLPQTPKNNYWTSIALISQASLTKALHWLNQIPENDAEWQPYALEAKAYIADLLNDNRLLQDCLEKLVSSKDQFVSARARIWLANCLFNQKQPKKAGEVLAPLFAGKGDEANKDNPVPSQLLPYAQLIQARLLAAQGKEAEAQLIASQIAESKTLPVKLKDLGRIALASINMEIEADKTKSPAPATNDASSPGQNNQGEDQLLVFISGRGDSPILAEAFNLLINQKTFESNPQAYEKLVSWANQSDQTRQPYASYTLADILFERKAPAEALDVVKRSMKLSPDHPTTRKLVLQTLNRLIASGDYETAGALIKDYPKKEAEIYFNSGVIAYGKKDYAQAARDFDMAIGRAGDSLIRESYYNANLNALAQGDSSRLSSLLKETYLLPQLQEKLAYEQAHYSAQNFEPQAIEKLNQFIHYYTSSPDRVNAMLDLAEVALNMSPPRFDIARAQIEELEKMELNRDAKVRLACLLILIPESQQIWPDAIAASRNALKEFPNHPKAPDIQLKLGELLFKNENFNEALLLLQSFPDTYPKSELKEEALFLAGKAAQQCDTETTLEKALDIFKGIAYKPGRFSQLATIEMAAILQRTGKSREAISTLQRLLNQKLSRQTRLLALSIQARAWATLTDDEEGNALQKARDLCTEILETPNLRPSWRFRTLWQRAQYAERAGQSDEALDDYYAILTYFPHFNSMTKGDWYWYYTAGFSALHILETKQDWEKALILAKTMAKTNGSRAREAASIARRIQMEHFIWNDAGDDAFRELEDKFFIPPAENPSPGKEGK